MYPQKSLYAAFDLYPSPKGAATHILHASQALLDYTQSCLLFALGNEKLPAAQEEENLHILRFNQLIPNYLQRAMAYAQQLHLQIAQMPNLQIVHFRDIWSGLAALTDDRPYRTVFEVNALPSIELPYRYNLSPSTLSKIQQLENYCLAQADAIICPSQIIKNALLCRQIPADKITVIPNGAEIPAPAAAPEIENYILYFGALQDWQGVDVLLRAFALLADYESLKLVICASNPPQQCKKYRKLVQQLALADRIIWQYQLNQNALQPWLQHALFTVAPLRDTPRNTAQGCSPLKIFESLAAAKAVVASDLPALREILDENENAKFVRPDRPADLARAMRFLLDYPDEAKKMGKNGQEKLKKLYTWTTMTTQMHAVYASL